jgi:hypothetical protein
MKSRITLIEFPVFMDYIVHVEITSDVRKSMKKYPQTKDITDVTNAMAVHVKDEPFSMIFLRYNAPVGTIAHESWHVIRRMMNYVGIELDSETVAYHLGYLVNKIFRFARGKR